MTPSPGEPPSGEGRTPGRGVRASPRHLGRACQVAPATEISWSKVRRFGVPFDKTVIANLETGRRRFVTVQELLALGYGRRASGPPVRDRVPGRRLWAAPG